MSLETPPPADARCPHQRPPSGRDEHKPGETDRGAAGRGHEEGDRERVAAARRVRQAPRKPTGGPVVRVGAYGWQMPYLDDAARALGWSSSMLIQGRSGERGGHLGRGD